MAIPTLGPKLEFIGEAGYTRLMKPGVQVTHDSVVFHAQSWDQGIGEAVFNARKSDAFNGLERPFVEVPLADGSSKQVYLEYQGVRRHRMGVTSEIPVDEYRTSLPARELDMNALHDPARGAKMYLETQGKDGSNPQVLDYTDTPITPAGYPYQQPSADDLFYPR